MLEFTTHVQFGLTTNQVSASRVIQAPILILAEQNSKGEKCSFR